ncbi:hypothetical protein QPI79_002212 [Enterococcus faecalis]|nr:hypothetical protein [Enterococcus faecalis]
MKKINKKSKLKLQINMGKQKKGKKKKDDSFNGERGFTYSFGYKESDAYLFIGNKTVISVFDILIQYGTNNPAPIGWLLNLIPREELVSGRVTFVQRQRGMEKKTEGEVIEKRLHSNAVTIENTNTTSAKQNAQNASRVGDMRISEFLAGQEDTIIDSDVRLVVKANSPEKVEHVISELKTAYKNADVKGVMLVRRTGQQLDEMQNLFMETSSDAWHSSDMSTVASSRLFLPSSGFSDETGMFVGYDIRSLLSNNPAVIDFQGVNNAVIFMGGVSPYVSVGGLEGGSMIINGGSAIAHAISESNYLSGKRTHHIVLSEFPYTAPDSLVFDMSKEAINPLETFGTPETVQKDANANFDKATTMMMLLAKEKTPNLEVELKKNLTNWFIYRAGGGGLYTVDPKNEPLRANRILANENHHNYPKPTDFLIELKANVAKRASEGELARKDASFLFDVMETTFTSYPNIFGETTTLPDVYKSNQRNIYYDLSSISEDKVVTGAVFLNTLAYVTNRALEGEQIVIHGLDQIDIPVEPLIPYKDRIIRKNIGLITVFENSENKINPSTFSTFIGRLSRQDAVVLGGLTEEELQYINESWRQSLPAPVAKQLLASNNGILYFYRKKDRVGALIDTHIVL